MKYFLKQSIHFCPLSYETKTSSQLSALLRTKLTGRMNSFPVKINSYDKKKANGRKKKKSITLTAIEILALSR